MSYMDKIKKMYKNEMKIQAILRLYDAPSDMNVELNDGEIIRSWTIENRKLEDLLQELIISLYEQAQSNDNFNKKIEPEKTPKA